MVDELGTAQRSSREKYKKLIETNLNFHTKNLAKARSSSNINSCMWRFPFCHFSRTFTTNFVRTPKKVKILTRLKNVEDLLVFNLTMVRYGRK